MPDLYNHNLFNYNFVVDHKDINCFKSIQYHIKTFCGEGASPKNKFEIKYFANFLG